MWFPTALGTDKKWNYKNIRRKHGWVFLGQGKFFVDRIPKAETIKQVNRFDYIKIKSHKTIVL